MNLNQVVAILRRIETALGIPPQEPKSAPASKYKAPSLLDDLDLEAKVRAAVPLKGTAADLGKILLPDLNPKTFATLLGVLAVRIKPTGLEFSKHRKDHGPVVWTIQGAPTCPPDPST